MKLGDLKPAQGAKQNRKRVGRGNASGTGGTAGRGNKGQMSRSGSSTRSGFEGGQTPLYRRVPKRRGFNNIARKEYAVVNLDMLNKFEDGTEVTIQLLKDNSIVKNRYDLLKVLGEGNLEKKISIKANKFSKTALEKLQKAKVKVEVI